VWSINERRYLGYSDVRGPKWELWVPANHFDHSGDHHFYVRGPVISMPRFKPNFILDVYPHHDIRLRASDDRPQRVFPADDWLFSVTHGGQTQQMRCSTSPFTFAFGLANTESQSGEFLNKVDVTSCGALALWVRDFIRDLQTASRTVPLFTVGNLDHNSCIAAHTTSETFRIHAVESARHAARETANRMKRHFLLSACMATVPTAHRSVAADAATAARDAAVAAFVHDVAAIPGNAAVTVDRRSVGIQCVGLSKDKQVVEIPQHLVLSLLLDPHAKFNFHHRFGGSRAVLGGYPHPFDREKWVPVCVLDFTRLPALE
jgi:hypothetical protein